MTEHFRGLVLPFQYDSCDDEDKKFIWFFDCTFLEDFGKFRKGEKMSQLAIVDNCKLVNQLNTALVQEFSTKIFPIAE